MRTARGAFLTRQTESTPASTGEQTDAHAGIWLNNTARGIEGLMDVKDDVAIPSGWYRALVYAPTLLPGGGSCIEATTIHWNRQDYAAAFNHGLGAYDWCNGAGFVKYAPFDQWFKDRYARLFFDGDGQLRLKYYIIVAPDHPAGSPYSSDTWRIYLYNFSAGIYQQFVSITGVGQRQDGWSMYESMYMQGTYNGGACITLPPIRTLLQKVLRPDGTWVPPTAGVRVGASVRDGNCFRNGTYTLQIDPQSDGDWWAFTPYGS